MTGTFPIISPPSERLWLDVSCYRWSNPPTDHTVLNRAASGDGAGLPAGMCASPPLRKLGPLRVRPPLRWPDDLRFSDSNSRHVGKRLAKLIEQPCEPPGTSWLWSIHLLHALCRAFHGARRGPRSEAGSFQLKHERGEVGWSGPARPFSRCFQARYGLLLHLAPTASFATIASARSQSSSFSARRCQPRRGPHSLGVLFCVFLSRPYRT